jgi:hypothetical protein
MDRIQKWEMRIAEKEERMLREIKLIQERNNSEDQSSILKVLNIIRCRTNKSQIELDFERINQKRQAYLKRNKIVEDEAQKNLRELEF